MAKLAVHEILHTVQGEGTRSGLACAIVRLHGCNLACSWCDTDQSDAPAVAMDVEEIVSRVRATGRRLVEITGGEPLVQEATPGLCRRLAEHGLEVCLETNGSLDVSTLPPSTRRIMDLKTPSSGESERMLLSNVDHLGPEDEVKFVIADERDWTWMRGHIETTLGAFRGTVLVSPLTPGIDPGTLAGWILRDRADVRLNLQIHKILFPGGEAPMRV